ncbi:MAG TPA: class I SAM-dependent methyltransferase [Anaerolineales bacterium]|nr:class I SAM-dependent methyltransferase [Anaerolineales bacterium]
MDPREYEIMFHAEEQHWWYLGMAAITKALVDSRIHPSQRLKILDAGCGTGAAMTTYLAEYGNVTGVDLYKEAVSLSRKRHASNLARASILHLPLAPASFDLVTSFDVLYERGVADELQALREFFRVLVPGGHVLIRLPAYDWLRGRHDERVHTRRRFTKKLLGSLLEQSGFRVEHLSYANMVLFPLALLKRLGERFLPPSGEESDLAVSRVNEIFRRILSWEAPFVSSLGLPYGLSVFAIARKDK